MVKIFIKYQLSHRLTFITLISAFRCFFSLDALAVVVMRWLLTVVLEADEAAILEGALGALVLDWSFKQGVTD